MGRTLFRRAANGRSGRMPSAYVIFWSLVLVAVACPASSHGARFIVGLDPATPELPSGEYGFFRGSADGTVWVTSKDSRTPQPNEIWQWTLERGFERLALFDSDVTSVAVHGSSADGTTIVGWYEDEGGKRVFRWSEESGIVEIPVPDGFTVNPDPGSHAISADKSTIALGSRGLQVFLWNEEEGRIRLLGSGKLPSSPHSLSADGSVVVGTSGSWPNRTAWQWSVEAGRVVLEALEGATSTWVTAMTPDGSIAVGSSGASWNALVPVRWDSDRRIEILPGWDPAEFGSIQDVSDDGSIIVGNRGRTGDDHSALIWDEQHGPRDLQQVLATEYGLESELSGWELARAMVVSADGLRIQGSGYDPSGEWSDWLAILGPSYQPGDANRDYVFDTTDLVRVLEAGKYEQDEVAIWAEGDWNWDCYFTSSDMVAALATGNYEAGPYAHPDDEIVHAHGVPEPTTLTLILLAVLGLLCQRRSIPF